MAVKGINKVVNLSVSLKSLRKPGFAKFMAEGLTVTILGLIDKGFRTSTDPYGKPWKKLAASTVRKKGFKDILMQTGTMRSSFVVSHTQKGPKVTNATPYSIFHQQPDKDSSTMPKRKMLPDGRGIPASWRKGIEYKTGALVKKWLASQ